MQRVMLFPALAVVAVACSESPSSSELTIDPAVVKSQSSALASAVTSAESSEGPDIAAELATIGNTASALIPRTRGAARGQMTRGSGNTCRCGTAAQKTCTFDACSVGTATVSGTVSWADGKLACTDLVFEIAALGNTRVEGESVAIGATHIAVTCSFAYGGGTLDGTLRTTGSTTVNDVTYGWDASLTASDVTLSSRSFTGGSVDVAATVTTSSAAEGTDTFRAKGSVAFP